MSQVCSVWNCVNEHSMVGWRKEQCQVADYELMVVVWELKNFILHEDLLISYVMNLLPVL